MHLSSCYTATALLADLCTGFTGSACTKFHQSFLQSLGSHSKVLLRAEERPQIR